MENKLKDLAFGISVSDSEILDNAFEDFERNAEITEEEQNRILASVMRKADFDMNENITIEKNTNKKSKIIFRRFAAVLAAAAIAVGTVPLLVSADVGNTYDILYSVSPAIAQSLKPVNRYCESNGIEMNVISANIEDDSVYVYIAVTDVESDRLDSTVDLFDSYYIKTPFDASCGCHLDHYDEETNTAYFFIQISDMNGASLERLKNKKITFSVGTMIANKQNFEGELTEIDLTSVPEQSEAKGGHHFLGYSTEEFVVYSEEEEEQILCLIPNSEPLCNPVDGVTITGIGYVDGQLHIQAHYDNVMKYDNHGFISLVDKDGNQIYSKSSFSFLDEDNEENSYEESIFDIPYEDISDYTIYGEFTTCKTRIDGDWEVTFKID